MPEPQATDAQIRDVRPKIRPMLPGNMQARLLGGIALLMVLVIAFSGRKPIREQKSVAALAPPILEPNPPRIKEYRTNIDAAARQLAAEEAELTQAKQAFIGEAAKRPAGAPASGGTYSPYSSGSYRDQSEGSPLQAERDKREYQSLFASNIALSYRPAATPAVSAALAAAMAAPTSPVAPASVPVPEKDRFDTGALRLLEGTLFETVLTNRLDSSFSGPVNCMVTTNVYSRDHSTLLIPQGSRVLGEARKVEGLGEQRLAVFFHRLIRPDDESINLDRFQGLDQAGATGLRDQVNHHYAQIFGASVAIGAIAGLAQANTHYGGGETSADVYQQGVTSSLSQSALHVLDRYLNVLPTFTIREGQRIKIYLAQDLTVPPYDPANNR